MKSFALSILLISGLVFGFKAEAQEVHINRTANERMTIYSRPGLDYQRCQPPYNKTTGCTEDDRAGWPDGSAEVKYVKDPHTGLPKKVETEGENPATHEYLAETWYEIETTYEVDGKKVTKRGWIEASDLIQTKPQRPSLKKEPANPACSAKNNSKKSCRQETANQGMIEETLSQIQKQILAPHEAAVEKASTALYGVVGQCSFTPPLTEPKRNWTDKKPLYDQELLPLLQGSMGRLPMISAQAGVKISPSQLIEIDMMSRTIYGEMAKCHHLGLQYMQMVARVILNRAEKEKSYQEKFHSQSEFTGEGKFFKMDHREDETPVQSVLTSAKKFNNWDIYFYKKGKKGEKVKLFNESGVNHALCPPADPKVFWGSYLEPKGAPRVSSKELQIWQDVRRIATEAILFPKEFAEKTSGVKDIYFFQSKTNKDQNMSVFNGRPRVQRSIAGQPIKVDTCAVLYGADATVKTTKKTKGKSR